MASSFSEARWIPCLLSASASHCLAGPDGLIFSSPLLCPLVGSETSLQSANSNQAWRGCLGWCSGYRLTRWSKTTWGCSTPCWARDDEAGEMQNVGCLPLAIRLASAQARVGTASPVEFLAAGAAQSRGQSRAALTECHRAQWEAWRAARVRRRGSALGRRAQ